MGFVAKPTLLRVLDRLGALATLLLPLFLVHWRGIAEGCLDGLAVGFLLRSGLTRDWSWCRQGFVWPALVWWGWLLLCSLPRQLPVPAEATASLTQALLAIRFPVAAFALAFWTLQKSWTRTWCRRLIVACVLYLGGQMLLQAVTGHNLFGNPRFGDGTLTGPYDKPRVSTPFALLGLPAALFVGALLGERVRRCWQIALVTGAPCCRFSVCSCWLASGCLWRNFFSARASVPWCSRHYDVLRSHFWSPVRLSLDCWRVGLFGAAVLHEWPLSSQSAFLNMPLGGIAFLLLGAGLAEAVRDLKADRPDDGETARDALTLSQRPHG
ncbi:hypothetical protein JK185_14160 [Gluconobacter wancherniae]|uniref:hypothetical protein n=1 Tax=Gluconobacter wancherniae TaxID=1307955 RepID=UPI001B8ABC41|nr:hypothetical protein [Gluconobacter wancherniae]MBS1064145.1 hypothetical protein [Gluconobacter wancherniae]